MIETQARPGVELRYGEIGRNWEERKEGARVTGHVPMASVGVEC